MHSGASWSSVDSDSLPPGQKLSAVEEPGIPGNYTRDNVPLSRPLKEKKPKFIYRSLVPCILKGLRALYRLRG